MVNLENRELYHERGAGEHHPLLRHHDQEGLHSQGGIKDHQRDVWDTVCRLCPENFKRVASSVADP